MRKATANADACDALAPDMCRGFMIAAGSLAVLHSGHGPARDECRGAADVFIVAPGLRS
jgi:hypothetical protein